ncbi:MAG: DUF3880 domain-containing protein [Lachnospiraceae bacterium]|nr:DUF3880 domain-containing protein [Lachnospiraceae bacterium]
MKSKKVLVVVWTSFNNDDVIRAIQSLGFECDFLDMRGKMHNDDEYADEMSRFLRQHRGEFCFVYSTNFYSFISTACHENNIDYIAWTYDSPWGMGDSKHHKYETTHFFVFDNDEAERYKDMGATNFFYLPLAVNTDKYDNIFLSGKDRSRFGAQGSFVGKLYNDRLQGYLQTLDDYRRGFFNGIIDYNTGIYDSYGIEDIFARDYTEWLNKPEFIEAVYEGEKATPEPLSDKTIDLVLSRVNYLTSIAVSNKERLILISLLSKDWDFKLFSNQTHSILGSVKECGSVDYNTEMPKVFKASDINLNITIKCIKSGIPLRCLDVMGCGGFLLSNYQRDFDEHFKDGVNIALYSSFDEAYDKFKYYTEHESERKKVAQNGYETVKKYYNFKGQLTKAIELSGLGHLLK